MIKQSTEVKSDSEMQVRNADERQAMYAALACPKARPRSLRQIARQITSASQVSFEPFGQLERGALQQIPLLASLPFPHDLTNPRHPDHGSEW